MYETKWYQTPEGRWIEIWKTSTERLLTREPMTQWLPVDSRQGTEPLLLTDAEVFNERGSDKIARKVGTRIRIDYTQTFQATENRITGPDGFIRDMWCLPSTTPAGFEITSVRITHIHGYHNTHRCGYCQDYATTPQPGDTCVSCGAEEWVEWHPARVPQLGLQEPPEWVKP